MDNSKSQIHQKNECFPPGKNSIKYKRYTKCLAFEALGVIRRCSADCYVMRRTPLLKWIADGCVDLDNRRCGRGMKRHCGRRLAKSIHMLVAIM